MKKFDKKELNKIIVLGFLLIVCFFLIYYFHFILKTEIVFTHLFYIPIILASLWWARKGTIIAVSLAVMLLFINLVDPIDVPIYLDLVRASMFIVISIIIGVLSEKRYLLESKLRVYSKNLEERVEERTTELRESRYLLEKIINSNPDWIFAKDKNYRYMLVNDSYASGIGKLAEDLIGKNDIEAGFSKELIFGNPDKGITGFRSDDKRVLNGEIIHNKHDTATSANEDFHIFDTYKMPLRDHNGNIYALLSCGRDITELKQAEKVLQEAHEQLEKKVAQRTKELQKANLKLQDLDRLKSMFIASMSHELRTPLNSIIGFTGIILQGMSGEINKEQRKQLTLVKNSANHLLSLINDVIDISKIEANKVELYIQEFDLSLLAQEIKESFAGAIEDKGLELSFKSPPTILIKSDERRTKQVLVNFISNALKFTDRGEIEIKIVKKDETAVVSVRDTGIGINKEDMGKLFQAFIRIAVMGRLTEGTGLGLYLSKKITDLLGGDIKVESEFGKGSVFTLALPLKR